MRVEVVGIVIYEIDQEFVHAVTSKGTLTGRTRSFSTEDDTAPRTTIKILLFEFDFSNKEINHCLSRLFSSLTIFSWQKI